MRCTISSAILNAIRREAALVSPVEGCGLLFGMPGHVTRWSATANVAADPTRRFEIDPAALFAALRTARAGGPAIAGYWHSHPSGDATPSATDAAMAAADGRLWLIVGAEVRGWRAIAGGAVHGRFDPVELVVA